MNTPLVTIVTAAYRSRPPYLLAAVESARSQSFRDFELIVSDDSPDDRLGELIAQLGDARVCYRHNQPPLGVAQNHWKCLSEARGEFVVVLNHDDVLEPTFLARLIQPLQSDDGLALSFCDHWIIDGQGERKLEETEVTSQRYGRSTLQPGRHRPYFPLLLRQTIPMAMGSMFRRSALPATLPNDSGPAYDLWLTYLLCRSGLGAWYVPDRLSSWRAHESNLTSAGDISLLLGAARCWSTIAADENMREARRAATCKMATAYYSCARWYYRQNQRSNSRLYAWYSLRAHATWRAVAAYVIGVLSSMIGRRTT